MRSAPQTNCRPIIATADQHRNFDQLGHHWSSLPESSWLAGSVARTCVCVCPSLPRTHRAPTAVQYSLYNAQTAKPGLRGE